MSIWTIYAQPKDFPEGYVVRRWMVGPGKASPAEAYTAETLEDARQGIPPGLHRMERTPEDDPAILESWI